MSSAGVAPDVVTDPVHRPLGEDRIVIAVVEEEVARDLARLRLALTCAGSVALRGDQAPRAPGLQPEDLLIVSERDLADLTPGELLLVSMEGRPAIRPFAGHAWRGRPQLALRRGRGWWPRVDHVDWEDLVGVVTRVPRSTGGIVHAMRLQP